jgi:nucleotide-binding universal stress UspA family protein
MFSQIMVALDGSALSEQAIKPAAHLAQLSGAKIVLVRNQDLPENILDSPDKFPVIHEILQKEGQACLAYLDRLAARIRESGLEASSQLLHGASAAESIRAYADEQKADLIVLTSHGRSGVSRFLLGSVAEKVARIAPCPVLIIGRDGMAVET